MSQGTEKMSPTNPRMVCRIKLWMPMLLGVAMFGCGPQNKHQNNPDHIYDSKMTAHIEEFKKDAAAHGVTLSLEGLNYANVLDQAAWLEFINRESLTNETVGFCKNDHLYKVYTKAVLGHTVDSYSDYTTSTSVTLLESPDSPLLERVTAYHELGHCVLGLKHTDSENSIMSAIRPDEDYLRANMAELLKQLFGPQ